MFLVVANCCCCCALLLADCCFLGNVSWMRIMKRSIPKKFNLLFAFAFPQSAVNKNIAAATFRTLSWQVRACNESLVPLCFLWGVCSCIFSFVLLLPHVCQTTDRSGLLHLVVELDLS
jgi:hypothetical protein